MAPAGAVAVKDTNRVGGLAFAQGTLEGVDACFQGIIHAIRSVISRLRGIHTADKVESVYQQKFNSHFLLNS